MGSSEPIAVSPGGISAAPAMFAGIGKESTEASSTAPQHSASDDAAGSGVVRSLPPGTWAAHERSHSADANLSVEPKMGSQLPPSSRGAFFCRFHVNGDPRLAHCYFKDL